MSTRRGKPGGDLVVSNLVVRYGPVLAVDGVSLRIGAGEMLGIVGRNGAGKSSVMRAICGLHRASGGSILWDGERIDHLPASRIVGRGIAYVPEGRRIFSALSVEDNLRLGAWSRESRTGRDNDMLERVYALFPVLRERARQAGGTLSGGQQQMLAIGRALMSEPALLLLDEPSMGLAPIVVQELFDQIRALHKTGMSVLIVEQKAHLTLQMVDHALVIAQGKVVASGRGPDLLDSGAVQAAYLGGGTRTATTAPAVAKPSADPSCASSAQGTRAEQEPEPPTETELPGTPRMLPAAGPVPPVLDLAQRDQSRSPGEPRPVSDRDRASVLLKPGERTPVLGNREAALREQHRRRRP